MAKCGSPRSIDIDPFHEKISRKYYPADIGCVNSTRLIPLIFEILSQEWYHCVQ